MQHRRQKHVRFLRRLLYINMFFSRFKRNRGNFGGAIFIEIDENVESKRNSEKYLLNLTQFVRNEAEEGGAVYVGNGRIALGERSFNAKRFVLRFLDCLFEKNRYDWPSQKSHANCR